MSPIISRTGFSLGFGRRRGGAVAPPGPGLTATGGTVTAAGITPGNGYRYHVFTAPGTFVVTAPGAYGNTVEYLVIAGGGGSAPYYGAGGGAGGFRTNVPGHPLAGSAFPVSTSPGVYPVSVGAGGPVSTSGNLSSFGSITSDGGGYGGIGGGAGGGGAPGGSGGGGGVQNGVPASPGGAGNTPPTTPPQGNPGGAGYYLGTYPVGGGGGAGGPGGDAGGNGGQGGGGGAGSPIPAFAAPLISPEIPGPAQPTWIPAVGPTGFYAGGGAGGSPVGSQTGGAGGGGGPTVGGVNFTGGGAGGSTGSPGAGLKGGDGIVIIRYLA